MAHRYHLDENVVPDLQCYEILTPDQDELHLPDSGSDSAWPYATKPSSCTNAPPDSSVVVSQNSDSILQVHHEYGSSVGNAGGWSTRGTDNDALYDVQTVPTSVDLNLADGIVPEVPLQESHQTSSAMDCVPNNPNHTPSAPKLPLAQQGPVSLLDLLIQHQESHGDGPTGERSSVFNFDSHCNCDAHLVPRWYLEE